MSVAGIALFAIVLHFSPLAFGCDLQILQSFCWAALFHFFSVHAFTSSLKPHFSCVPFHLLLFFHVPSPQSKLLGNIWSGQITTQLICKDCPHTSEKHDTFFTISLDIQGKVSIIEIWSCAVYVVCGVKCCRKTPSDVFFLSFLTHFSLLSLLSSPLCLWSFH